MSEPDISTLARRLAEQNNVDWRALSGSGPDGKVVERDVLDFLARVMAGDEATNPTPEPLPDGMATWPDQDLNDVRAGVGEAATLGNLRQELGNAMKPEVADGVPEDMSDGAGDPFGEVESVALGSTGVGAAEVAPGDANLVDEDIFLFDDPAADGLGADAVDGAGGAHESTFAQQHGAEHEATVGAVSDDLDDLLVAGDEVDGDGDDAGGFTADEPGRGTAGADSGGTAEGAASSFGGLNAGSFDESGDDDSYGGASAEAEALDAPGYGSELADGGSAGAADSSWTQPDPSSSEPGWGSNIALGNDGGSQFGQAEDAADDSADLWGEAETTSSTDDGLWTTADDVVGEPVERDLFEPGGDEEPVEAAPDDQTVEPLAEPDDETAEPVAEPGDQATGRVAEPDDQATGPMVEPDDEAAERLAEVEDEAADADELPGVTAGVSSTADLPLARSGMMLRRHIDLSALAACQLAVGNELGFDEPLGVAPFLLRAVAKAAGELNVPSSHVALAVLDNGLELRRVDDAAGRSFASLVEELAGPAVAEDEPRLVAADLSGLDLDEALLDLDVPVVTLGRILYDNQRGAYRSTLALTGVTQPDAGARLLARVAELLDAPVRLVL
ncbi:MAG TPA: E3 binding domain-containing protein [Trueperaceae bacterium]|nr:E3 binding domain-containing protein [Trueperaceae bacterium]